MPRFSQRHNDIDGTDVNTAVTLDAERGVDSGDSRIKGNAMIDWTVVFAPLTGNTRHFDFQVGGLFMN